MSELLGLSNTLDRLEQLKRAVQEAVRRTDQLEQESGLNSSRLDRQFDRDIKELDTRLSTALADVDAVFQSPKENLLSSRDRRHSVVIRAHSAARKFHLRIIESREGRQINEVQRELLQTSRHTETSRRQAETNFANFQQDSARELAELTDLERRTRNAFRGYAAFCRWLDAPPETPPTNSTIDEHRMLDELRALLGDSLRQLRKFRRAPLPFLFSLLPPGWLAAMLAAAHVGAALLLPRFALPGFTWQHASVSFVACLGGAGVLHFLGRLAARSSARTLAVAIRRAVTLFDLCAKTAEAHFRQELERIRQDSESRTEYLHQRWNRAVEEAEAARRDWKQRLDDKMSRASAKNDQLCRLRLEHLQQERDRQVECLTNEATAERSRLEESRAAKKRELQSGQRSHWQALETEWQATTRSIYDDFAATRQRAEQLFPEWRAPTWDRWEPPAEFFAAAPFARVDVDVEQLAGSLPRHPRLALPGPARFSLPLVLTFTAADRGSILIETKNAGRDLAIGALNNLVLRLLSVAPPGRVLFTILDPHDLGQSFAGLMHLTDHEERLINRRIWTQPEHIEQRLGELNEHVEKVTQLYLRNEYATIAEYNEQAGRIAEPYHYLVIADFPVNFSDLAMRRLLSIIASGPRCGVFTLIHWDSRKTTTAEFVPEDLRKGSACLRWQNDRFVLAGEPDVGTSLLLDSPPDPDRTTAFLDNAGRSSVDSNRVEMPFADVAPQDSQLWSLDTGAELRVPIGRTGATKYQHLALGRGTRQHVLIAGKTGSGKSTLFHVIITNLALWCSPDQVEFCLVDFKKGVEFKCYAACRLPHARVVAIESDREFGLSVLERVDEELKRRGDLFRRLGVQDLPGYRRNPGAQPLPRTLLIIDEFQEFFVEDDRISQNAALLLDRLVRQGRAFGIHVLLGSQTLAGAYTLARATTGQMVVRIALQCNEADAYLIMDDDNPAPRLLSRPGEAIYNDASGALAGNSPFQIVWLSDAERAGWLEKIRQCADRLLPAGSAGPVVFEGNAPADVRENAALRGLLEADAVRPEPATRAWLGAPNSIKGPTEVAFRRQSGHNLLIIGQHDESTLAMLGVSGVSLAAQHPRGTARFILLDIHPPDSRPRQFLEKIVSAIPHPATIAGNADLGPLFAQLADELDKRTGAQQAIEAPAVYLLIHGIQRFKGLRHADEFTVSLDDSATSASPARQLDRILCEGTQLGFHVICACDTLNNANRFFSRKTLSEFELRVLFQMSASDSASLIDTPKAASLGLHRAILHNAQTGVLETFRPYGLPDADWLETSARHLARLVT